MLHRNSCLHQLPPVDLRQVQHGPVSGASQFRQPFGKLHRHISAHLVTALPDPRPDRRPQIARFRVKFGHHSVNSGTNNIPSRPPPPRMRRRHHPPFRVHQQHGYAIRGLDRYPQPHGCGHQRVPLPQNPRLRRHRHSCRMDLFHCRPGIFWRPAARPLRPKPVFKPWKCLKSWNPQNFVTVESVHSSLRLSQSRSPP